MKIRMRWNVLVLMGAGYVTLVVVSVGAMLMGEVDAAAAVGLVKDPLMALIGGSLAISMDLVGPKEEGDKK